MIVVDASALAPTLIDDGEAGNRARSRLAGRSLTAPQLIDLEVAAAIRRQERLGRVDEASARDALADLAQMPLDRRPHRPLLERCWDLRHNLSVYDAAYVALAELLGAPLLTADIRLARASGPRCAVELLS